MTLRVFARELKKVISRPYNINDIIEALNGEYLANGCYRSVYQFKDLKNWVLKYEYNLEKKLKFCNIREYNNWQWMFGSCYEKWLAECRFLSTDGRLMLQRKADPVDKKSLPKKIPPFFCDKKPENFGVVDGRIVCIDYPDFVPDYGRMKRANWK